jgi:hypothetical protein
MSYKSTTGLNWLGPSPRALRESTKRSPGWVFYRKPWKKRRQRLDAERFARWRAAHPEWQLSPEQVQRRDEMVKRSVVRTAVGNALQSGHAVTTNNTRKITLPKLNFQEIEP